MKLFTFENYVQNMFKSRFAQQNLDRIWLVIVVVFEKLEIIWLPNEFFGF